MYVLHYPGLLFLFPIPAQHAEHCSSRSGDLPLELPDGSTPIAARICIYAGPAGAYVNIYIFMLARLCMHVCSCCCQDLFLHLLKGCCTRAGTS